MVIDTIYNPGLPACLIRKDENGIITFRTKASVCADGAARAYAPRGQGLHPLDDLDNAGKPGNYYGIVTIPERTGRPVIQGPDDPYPGYFVSPTALQREGYKVTDPRRYYDAETVPFVVVPGGTKATPRYADWGLHLGEDAIVTHSRTGKTVRAIVAEVGPGNRIGEVSIAVARALGIPDSAINGGEDSAIIDYTIYCS